MEKKIQQIAKDALAAAKSQGMSDEDAKWMAQGAVMCEGRNQGVIGEELSKEMQAAIAQVVKQEQKQHGKQG